MRYDSRQCLNHPWIQKFSLKNDSNIGLQKTLNKGIKASSGEFIARMDGDDYCSLNRFELQIDFLNILI